MTREEAKQWLEVINTKEFGWDEFALQESQREIRERCEECVRESLRMAIEALSADTVEIKPIEIKGDFRIDDDYKKTPQIIGNVEVVVRCKDCVWGNEWNDKQIFCDRILMRLRETDFCSYGERREPIELPQYAEWKDAFDNLKVVKK